MYNVFCPFIKGPCHDDCVFRCNKTVVRDKIYSCLIAVKLSDINEMQHDDLVEIVNALKEK